MWRLGGGGWRCFGHGFHVSGYNKPLDRFDAKAAIVNDRRSVFELRPFLMLPAAISPHWNPINKNLSGAGGEAFGGDLHGLFRLTRKNYTRRFELANNYFRNRKKGRRSGPIGRLAGCSRLERRGLAGERRVLDEDAILHVSGPPLDLVVSSGKAVFKADTSHFGG